MVKQKVTITNPTGLHLRPAGIFCNTASSFKCKVTFEYGNTTANAKSVLSVLGACIKKGDEIELVCEGTVGNFDVHLHFGIYLNDENGTEFSVNSYSILKYLEDKRVRCVY